MSSSTLALTTRSCRYDFTIEHFEKPEETLAVPTNLQLVTGMTLPDGTTYNNRYHSSDIHIRSLVLAPKSTAESITLPDEKAHRLVSLFRQLRPKHGLECHDLFAQVELWPDIVEQDYTANILGDDRPITPGTPYSVESNFGTADDPRWIYTHSCMGTDRGNLLGIIGRGMMLAVMDRESTENLYARGGDPYLATVTV